MHKDFLSWNACNRPVNGIMNPSLCPQVCFHCNGSDGSVALGLPCTGTEFVRGKFSENGAEVAGINGTGITNTCNAIRKFPKLSNE